MRARVATHSHSLTVCSHSLRLPRPCVVVNVVVVIVGSFLSLILPVFTILNGTSLGCATDDDDDNDDDDTDETTKARFRDNFQNPKNEKKTRIVDLDSVFQNKFFFLQVFDRMSTRS